MTFGLYYGAEAARFGGRVVTYGHGHAAYPGGFVIATSDAAGTGENVMFRATGATATPQAVFPRRAAGIGNAMTNPSIAIEPTPPSTVANYGWAGSSSLEAVLGGNVYLVMTTTAATFRDNWPLTLGDGSDDAFVHRVATLPANTALGSVLQGTPVSTATPADSLLQSVRTAGGDWGLYVNVGGHSYEMLKADNSQVGVNLMTSANVPANTDIAAGQLRFTVDGSDQLTAYWNKAGSVKSLVIGTLA